MGRWSRAVGAVFIEWMEAPAGARWLDVGCGTGIFTELILDTCAPAAVSAVDPAPAQIDHARRSPIRHRVAFSVADAQALPFGAASFDVVSSALVINFIPDRPRALAEMRRVVGPEGHVAGYVWEFGAELSPSWPLRQAMRQVGAEAPEAPGAGASSIDALVSLFDGVGLKRIEAQSFDVTVSFDSFEAFWRAQTPSYSPISKKIAAMSASQRTGLMETMRDTLPATTHGTISYSARANAVKSRRE